MIRATPRDEYIIRERIVSVPLCTMSGGGHISTALASDMHIIQERIVSAPLCTVLGGGHISANK